MYEPVIEWLPIAPGVYETLHPATPTETAVIEQLADEKVPGELETKVTLPVGVIMPPLEESVIAAVQLEA